MYGLATVLCYSFIGRLCNVLKYGVIDYYDDYHSYDILSYHAAKTCSASVLFWDLLLRQTGGHLN